MFGIFYIGVFSLNSSNLIVDCMGGFFFLQEIDFSFFYFCYTTRISSLYMRWVFHFSLLLFLGACQGAFQSPVVDWMRFDGKIKILATTAQVAYLVEKIGGEQIDTLTLIVSDLDPHSYELVKGDLEKFERADWVFCSGAGLEHGASLAHVLKTWDKVSSLGDFLVQEMDGEILYKEGRVDPHLWMDVGLWAKSIPLIVKELSRLDPEHVGDFQRRGLELLRELQELDARIEQIIQSIPEHKRYLVTSHDAFEYFVRRYFPGEDWQRHFEAPEGLAPEGQLGPKDLQKTLSFLQEHGVSVVFPESNVNADSIVRVAEVAKAYGVNVRVCDQPLYGDSMGGLSYFLAMEHNARVLREEL